METMNNDSVPETRPWICFVESLSHQYVDTGWSSLMNVLHLGPISGIRKRRVGLTARTPIGGNLLIMHKLRNQPIHTLDDVSHKPLSSSDDSLSEASCGASDDSALSNPRPSAEAATASFQRQGQSVRSSPRTELVVDQSNISSTPFSPAGRSSGLLPGDQTLKRNFRTMNGGLADDDERPVMWAQDKPKPQRKYGQTQRAYNRHSSQNASSSKSTKETKYTSSGAGKKPQDQDKSGLLLPCMFSCKGWKW